MASFILRDHEYLCYPLVENWKSTLRWMSRFLPENTNDIIVIDVSLGVPFYHVIGKCYIEYHIIEKKKHLH